MSQNTFHTSPHGEPVDLPDPVTNHVGHTSPSPHPEAQNHPSTQPEAQNPPSTHPEAQNSSSTHRRKSNKYWTINVIGMSLIIY